MIRTLEELSLNAWPSLQTLLYDGWVLRFAMGYTRRANSIIPLDAGLIPAEEKIAQCELIYQRQELPVIYKLAGREEARELDALSAQRGYQADAETSLQLLSLQEIPSQQPPEVEISTLLSSTWNTAFQTLSGLDEHRHAIHCQLLRSILLPTCYASVRVGQQVVGCALGVMQAGYLGIFDVVVHPEHRRQGHGERLMHSLLAWAQQQGAHTAYLQVMLNNAPALRLYKRLGFQEAYQYWYRVKRTHSSAQ